MANNQSAEVRVATAERTSAQPPVKTMRRHRLASLLFGGREERESVKTRVHAKTDPETVWRGILFYEEVGGRAPLLLRTLIPRPLRTEGPKTEVGAKVLCSYQSGTLMKRITVLEPPHRIEFEVIGQHLGIEGCAAAESGSYSICGNGQGADVILTTNYRAYLHPRGLWRPLERLVIHCLHRHILSGMRGALHPAPAMPPHAQPAEICDTEQY